MKKAMLPALLRRALIAWLGAATLEYLLLPASQRGLSGYDALLAASPLRALLVGAALFLFLCLGSLALGRSPAPKGSARQALAARISRQAPALLFTAMAAAAARSSFSWGLVCGCLAVILLLIVYALFGWDGSPERVPLEGKPEKGWAWLTAAAALGVFAVLSLWGIARVRALATPTYDFGIFAQMFEGMRRTGAPVTTLERGWEMSHFKVHISPIYYLLLPFYCLVPRPETLQVLQAAVMCSAAIPLWKLGRLHGLSGGRRFLLCCLLLLAPAFSGGAAFDLHENCFLTPLLLWLLWGLDAGSRPVTILAALLTLCVKEDAAVYVAVVGLYVLLRALLHPARRGQLRSGLLLMAMAMNWFVLATLWLSRYGDGVMVSRYRNLIYDGSGSLLTVVRAVLLCPLKALNECLEPEKLPYLGLTLGAMLGLPLWTRRYERYVLLIPWLLFNLLSDYVYQHDILFQYSFGSLACLSYLCCVNLQPRPQGEPAKGTRRPALELTALALAVILSVGCTVTELGPTVKRYVRSALRGAPTTDRVREILERIPEEASVTASTYYTVPLSGHAELYDLGYAKLTTLLACDYVVVDLQQDQDRFDAEGTGNGTERLEALLEENGFRPVEELSGVLRVYGK